MKLSLKFLVLSLADVETVRGGEERREKEGARETKGKKREGEKGRETEREGERGRERLIVLNPINLPYFKLL